MSEQVLNQILEEMKNIKSDIKDIKTDVDSIKADMDTIKTDMDDMKSEMNFMKSEMSFMKSEMSFMKSEIKIMKSQLDENTQITKAIIHRQDETDAKLDSMAMDIHKMHGEMTALQKGQERQDRILESLAARSLEQESELRELKRN